MNPYKYDWVSYLVLLLLIGIVMFVFGFFIGQELVSNYYTKQLDSICLNIMNP